jgi:Transglycosylase SLT domain/SPOR domain
MKSATVVMLSFLVVVGGEANAQLAGPGAPIDHHAQPPGPPSASGTCEAAPRVDDTARTHGASLICAMVESAAVANGLPLAFFARVVWQESRLRPDAVGPMTRSGRRAQGIAQFMPLTAAERRLLNPFDPVQALPKSAEFLRELRAQFGNLGLAAAAYNAGPQRVRDWLGGKRTLPSETQAFVHIVTGRPAREWIKPEEHALTVAIPGGMPCPALIKLAGDEPTKLAGNEPTKLAGKSRDPTRIVPQTAPTWAVQLVGDRSETKALALYHQLQEKHKAILSAHRPVVIKTTLKVSAVPIWNRVRIVANSRETAEALCSRLRTAGESCLVQRN